MLAALLPFLAAFNYASQVGLAVIKGGEACLYIDNGSLTPGTRVSLVSLGPPQSVSQGVIVRKADAACPALPGGESDRHRYEFRVLKGKLTPAQPAFAISGFGGSFYGARRRGFGRSR